MAYSTWKSLPSGEKTVIARSYAPGAANTDIIYTSVPILYAVRKTFIVTTLKTFHFKYGSEKDSLRTVLGFGNGKENKVEANLTVNW
jgi:hypothetical protein